VTLEDRPPPVKRLLTCLADGCTASLKADRDQPDQTGRSQVRMQRFIAHWRKLSNSVTCPSGVSIHPE
jgi:hypothetical protein